MYSLKNIREYAYSLTILGNMRIPRSLDYIMTVTYTSAVLCNQLLRGHGGRVVTLSPPTSEAGVRFPARPQVGKLVVACRWSAVYSTEP